MVNQSSVVENHQIKHQRIVFELSITAHATPASKKHASDLPGVCLISSEGIDPITAVEDLSGMSGFNADIDNDTGDSVIHIMLKGSELGSIKKVMKVSLSEKTALATSLAISKLDGNFLTAGGNIALEVAGTGLNLASESPTLVLEVDYLLSE